MKDEAYALFTVVLVVVFCVAMIAMAKVSQQPDEEVNTALNRACGTCDEKGKMCGEVVCTGEGWK